MRVPGRWRKMDQDETGGRAITHTYDGLMDEFPGAFTYKNSAAPAFSAASTAYVAALARILLISLVVVMVLAAGAFCLFFVCCCCYYERSLFWNAFYPKEVRLLLLLLLQLGNPARVSN